MKIILGGGFTTPDIAEQTLKDGVCDFIGLERPMSAWGHRERLLSARGFARTRGGI